MGNVQDRARVLGLLATLGFALPVAAQTDPLAEPFGPTFDWRDLLPDRGGDGSLGYVLSNCGGEWSAGYGLGIRGGGDLNGDGLADLLHNVSEAAASLPVAWGALMGRVDRPTLVDISVTAANDGFQLAPQLLGSQAVAGVGDINGDGFDDAVGVQEGLLCGAGCYYYSGGTIVFGRDEAASGPFPTLLPIAPARVFAGITASIRPAPIRADINSDGINDLLFTSIQGVTSLPLVFGRPEHTPFPALASPAQLISETGGFSITADRSAFRFGEGGSAGDLNGDGIDDIGIESFGTSPIQGAYVIFGRGVADPFPSSLDVTTAEPSDVVLFQINDAGWFAGGIGTPGDVNGDGVDDIAIRAFNAAQNLRLYVVFGRGDAHADPFPPVVDLDQLNGDDGFLLQSDDGWSIPHARDLQLGDVNADQVDDLLLADSIIYGQQLVRYPAIVLPQDVPADQMVRFTSSDLLRLAPAGDTNGDGLPDLSATVMGDDCEVAAIIYGRRPPPPCRPDLDRDGVLTIFDFLVFQNAFDAREPVADYDGDGDFTLFDFLTYQNEFDDGCS
jgi:hypothetical protein